MMKKINIKTLKNFLYLIKGFYYSNLYSFNSQKKSNIIKKIEEKIKKKTKLNINQYLDQYKSISEIKIEHVDIDYTKENFIIKLSNDIFHDIEIKVSNNNSDNNKVLIYLPGYKTGSDNVTLNKNHPEYLLDFAKKNQLTLVTWDWPLHGKRLNNCLFKNINSVYNAEKEYSKILNLLGSSLFIEYIHEYKYILNILTCLFVNKKIINVGYSMGGFFSYFAPLLNKNIYKTISISSFNSYLNLFKDEKIKVNGQFYYPYNAINYFEMEDIIIDANKKSVQPLHIIFGDKDPNCNVEMKNNPLFKDLSINVLKNHGHEFSTDILKVLKNAL